jgi:hypothetical protein
MSFELIFRVAAKIDLIYIEYYYNNISGTITDNFFREFFETLNFIENEPPIISGKI